MWSFGSAGHAAGTVAGEGGGVVIGGRVGQPAFP